MKVTTDACILGAWTPVFPGLKRVLDIGTGTGLLSLMLAQRSWEIAIDAVEIDMDAAQQARENFMASPWRERLKIVEGDVRDHPFMVKYDLIICNPPFFNNSLLSNDANKMVARHTVELSNKELADVILANLAEDGYASVLLPVTEYGVWKQLAEGGGMHEHGALLIKHRADAEVKRIVGLFSKSEPSFMEEETLVIMDGEGNYTEGFRELLKAFYLAL